MVNIKAAIYFSARISDKHLAATLARALFGLHLPPETIRQVIQAEVVGVKATARLLELDKNKVNG